MARIHQLVLIADETTDLMALSGLLMEAVTLSREEDIAPYSNPMVRFICHKIAFAGDGDIQLEEYYRDILHHCVENAEFEDTIGKEPSEPVRRAS